VSPFSVGGWVCSDVFDHTSQLRFLETVFGVKAPNISAWRRKATGDLTSTLPVLAKPVTKVQKLPLTSASTTTGVVGAECTPSQILEVNTTTAPFTIQRPQKMPRQERGRVRRTPS
jgi:phospholipase C